MPSQHKFLECTVNSQDKAPFFILLDAPRMYFDEKKNHQIEKGVAT